MNDNHGHIHEGDQLQALCPEPEEIVKLTVSPLGWSINGRLVCAVAAAALLWLSVAWAIGWLP